MKNFYTLLMVMIFSLSVYAQSPGSCEPVWREVVWGYGVGSTGLTAGDLDQDGYNEIIALTNAGLFWFVLKYDTISGDYKRVWISGYSEGNPLPTLDDVYIMDTDSDSEPEIVLSFSDKIEIRNGNTYEIEFIIPDLSGHFGIFIADADNDGMTEFVIQDYQKTYLLTPGTYEIELTFNHDTYSTLKCGDVDGDSYNELVFSNKVTLLMPGDTIPSMKWSLFWDNTYGLHLSDVDFDGINEIIRCGDSLIVYDGENIKYADSLGYNTRLLLSADITADGNRDFLIDDTYGNKLICLNAADGSFNWYMDIENCMSPAALADTDNDGIEELIVAYTDYLKNDHLRIINPLTLEPEWLSDNSEFPFIEIADVDGDSNDEIIMVTVNSSTYPTAANLTIFDAASKEIEFYGSAHINASITGIAINDLDHDGMQDVILSGSSINNSGAIFILNGQDYSLKSSHYFENLFNFQTIRVADLNNDSEFEFIVRSIADIYIINSSDYSIIKQYPLPGNLTQYSLLVGNIDTDPNIEIIAAEDNIYIIDPQLDVITKTTDKAISAISLFDYDNDGIQEILAGTKVTGRIGIFKGEIRLMWLPVMERKQMEAVAATKGPDDKTLIVFQCDGFIKFMTMEGEILSSYDMSQKNYMTEIETADYNLDGITEVFASHNYEISEFSTDCYPCFFFYGDITITGSHCSQDDGSLTINLLAGEPPYSYLWNTGETSQSITGLSAGDYSISATDSRGCEINYETTVPDLNPMAAVTYQSPDLTSTLGCEGTAVIEVSNSEPPYYYSIDGSPMVQLNDTLRGLCEGLHQIVITDSFNCMYPFEIVVQGVVGMEEKSEMICRLYPVPASGKAYIEFPQSVTGTATICSFSGTILLSTALSGHKTELQLSGLKKGAYWLRIILDNGSIITKKIIVI